LEEQTLAEEKKGEQPAGKATEVDGLGDDLLDLFKNEAEVVDPTLALLTASLEDVDINDLLEQVREIQDIMDQRRGG
jgi:hypothetical protein